MMGLAAAWALEASLAAVLVLLLARRFPPVMRSWLLRLALLKFACPPLLGWPVLPAVGVDVPAAARAEWLMPAIVLAWLTGALVMLARGARERRILAGVLIGARPWMDPLGPARLPALAATAGLARAPRVRVSEGVAAPLVAGWRRPVIVLPSAWAAGATAREVELVLLHELAHVRRGDLGWLGLGSWLAVAWWWHPLFHRVVAGVRAAAEDACDDRARSAAGATAGEYAETLVRAVESAAGLAPVPAAALAAHATERRLRRLFSGAAIPAARLTLAQRLVLVALAAALLPGLAPRTGSSSPSHVHVLQGSHAGLHHHHHRH